MQGHALQGDSILWSEGIVIMDSLLINLNDKMDTVFNVYRLSDFSFLAVAGCEVKGRTIYHFSTAGVGACSGMVCFMPI